MKKKLGLIKFIFLAVIISFIVAAFLIVQNHIEKKSFAQKVMESVKHMDVSRLAEMTSSIYTAQRDPEEVSVMYEDFFKNGLKIDDLSKNTYDITYQIPDIPSLVPSFRGKVRNGTLLMLSDQSYSLAESLGKMIEEKKITELAIVEAIVQVANKESGNDRIKKAISVIIVKEEGKWKIWRIIPRSIR